MISVLLRGIILSFLLLGCATPSLDIFQNKKTLVQLPLPVLDHGYAHFKTRVITDRKEYEAFLSAIDAQKGWDHKVAFGMKIAKVKINFERDNLLIYRYKSAYRAKSMILPPENENAIVRIIQTQTKIGAMAQAFFYTVPKTIKKVTFKSDQRVETVQNSKNPHIVPRECIAWFDGCNHCIRAAAGRPMCTKRYCRKKGAFRCVKWQ